MTITQLIAELQKLHALHGDLPVAVADNEGHPNSHDITAEIRDDRLWFRDDNNMFQFEPKEFIFIF